MAEKLAGEPEVTVVSCGWVVIVGAEAVLTISLAALLAVMAAVFPRLSVTMIE